MTRKTRTRSSRPDMPEDDSGELIETDADELYDDPDAWLDYSND